MNAALLGRRRDGLAQRLLCGLYRPGYAYTKTGVMLLDLIEPEQISARLLPGAHRRITTR